MKLQNLAEKATAFETNGTNHTRPTLKVRANKKPAGTHEIQIKNRRTAIRAGR